MKLIGIKLLNNKGSFKAFIKISAQFESIKYEGSK